MTRRLLLVLALFGLVFSQYSDQKAQNTGIATSETPKTQSLSQQRQSFDSETIDMKPTSKDKYQNDNITLDYETKTIITICAAVIVLSAFILKKACWKSQVPSDIKDVSAEPQVVIKQANDPYWLTSQIDQSASLSSTIQNIKAKYLLNTSNSQIEVASSQVVQTKTP